MPETRHSRGRGGLLADTRQEQRAGLGSGAIPWPFSTPALHGQPPELSEIALSSIDPHVRVLRMRRPIPDVCGAIDYSEMCAEAKRLQNVRLCHDQNWL